MTLRPGQSRLPAELRRYLDGHSRFPHRPSPPHECIHRSRLIGRTWYLTARGLIVPRYLVCSTSGSGERQFDTASSSMMSTEPASTQATPREPARRLKAASAKGKASANARLRAACDECRKYRPPLMISPESLVLLLFPGTLYDSPFESVSMTLLLILLFRVPQTPLSRRSTFLRSMQP